MSDRPEAMRKRNIAAVRPLSDCAKTNERSGIETGPLTFSALTSSLSSPAARRQRLNSNCGPLPRRGGEGQGEGGDLVHELGRIDVGDGLHDREGVLRVFHRLPVKLAAVRLMIFLANRLLADGRI